MSRLDFLSRHPLLAPLRVPVFRRFWMSGVVSNLGAMVQMVAAAWLMTSLSGDPQQVALVQTATTLPVMLLSVMAGALADIFDLKKLLLVAQSGMALIALGLACLTLWHLVTPVVILSATFLIATGNALYAPVWQTSMRNQVSRDMLDAASGLNSVGFNVARSLGPAIGGLVLALWGASTAFLLNALSYVGLIVTIALWRPEPKASHLPPERVSHAILAGFRYVGMSPALLTVMIRSAAFGTCGSGLWALTAPLAHDVLHAGPADYGLLMGAFGTGAIIAAAVRTSLRINRGIIVQACSAAFGVSCLLLAVNPWLLPALVLMAVCGAAWVLALTVLSVVVQLSTPNWVAGRAISLNLMAVFSGMAAGSAGWGWVAHNTSVPVALALSGVSMLVTLLLAFHFRLGEDRPMDLSPVRDQPVDTFLGPIAPNEGPIVVTLEYRIPPENVRAFVAAMDELGRIRKRDGARRWSLLQNVDAPDIWLERFHSATWLDHVRRQLRPTVADQAIRDVVTGLCDGPPVVTRFIDRRPSDGGPREISPPF